MSSLQSNLCLYCQIQPALLGDRYCCEACRFLASLFKGEQTIAIQRKAEDPQLIQTFGQALPDQTRFECAVEPLACEACLQGLARLPELFPGLRNLQWNRRQSVLSFEFNKGQEFPSQIYSFLESISLKPRWKMPGATSDQLEQEKKQLSRIGVTGAIAGNLMLFSIPIYAGLEGTLQTVFEWIQFVLFLPVLLWSAVPFYRTALISIRMRQLSVDLPLVIAFLSGSLFSIWSLFQNTHDLYFDSLAGFFFLILVSRAMLEKSLSQHLQTPNVEDFFERPFYEGLRANEKMRISLHEIQENDLLVLSEKDRLPTDGILLEQACEVDTAWLNGEPEAKLRLPGSHLQAGSRLLSPKAKIQVTKTLKSTDFARLLAIASQNSEKLQTSNEARIATALVLGCFVLILGLFVFGSFLGIHEVVRRSISLLIVACPCAVSFAAPLARAKASKLALKKGFWIRNSQVWHRLLKSKKIAFDKTGTLTGGRLTLAPHSPLIDVTWKQVILSLENISTHPLAESLRRAWGPLPLLKVREPKEIIGVGVQGWIDGHFFELRTSQESGENVKLGFYRNQENLVDLELQDESNDSTVTALQELQKNHEIYILSGDRQDRVEKFAKSHGLLARNAWGDLKPFDKKEKIRDLKPDLYFGDGTNDLPALSEAPVSVAPAQATIEARATADLFMFGANLSKLPWLFELAQETAHLNRRNLTLALIYNIAAGLGALFGVINPLVAAILMPISSLLLLGSTLWGTRFFKKWEQRS